MHTLQLLSQAKLESDTLSCYLKAAAACRASAVLRKVCPRGTGILPLALFQFVVHSPFAVNYDLKLLNHAKCHVKAPFIWSMGSVRV